jgi:DNA-binding Lrp family transcriptional regulator
MTATFFTGMRLPDCRFGAPICRGRGQNAIVISTICRDDFGRLEGAVDKSTKDQAVDKTDHLLIAKLRENARASVSELGRVLGLSRTTVQSRIKRLERTKVITGYSIRVAESYEKNQIHAYLMIMVGPKRAAGVGAEIKRMAPVRLLQSVSGPFDLIALAVAPSVREMDDLIDAIGNLEGVERTTSSVVLSTKFDR